MQYCRARRYDPKRSTPLSSGDQAPCGAGLEILAAQTSEQVQEQARGLPAADLADSLGGKTTLR
jgi:hypothetical protein